MRKDGSQISVAFDGQIGRDVQGHFRQTHCILHDVTELKQKTESLQKSERMLRGILASSPVGICYTRNRRIQWVNDAWKNMFGFDSEHEYLDQPTAILHPSRESYEQAREVLYGHLEQGETNETEARLVRKDGSVFHALVRSTLLNPSNVSEGTISAISDISERVRYEERPSRKRREVSLNVRDQSRRHSVGYTGWDGVKSKSRGVSNVRTNRVRGLRNAQGRPNG